MTREEAIEYNKNLREYMRITDKESEYKFLKENYEALDLAIKALEQESSSSEIPNKSGFPTSSEDCISRDDVWDVMQELWGTSGELIDRLMSLPPVTPTHKKGKWEYDAYKDKSGGHCNCCGHFLRYGEKTNFCPDCGAKMEEVEE